MAERRSELFAGNDWQALHRAFTEVNFTAYDFDSIRIAMRDYIRMTYPEEFNDWIESSEFVAIIDLLAYLGGSIAYRVDLNAHENFLSTAESRESILRLARFLSYTPRRNYPARGLLKVTSIQTDDDVHDGAGLNLNSQRIQWGDPQNPDWFEQWTAILNSSLQSGNPFGNPLKTGTVGGVPTQLYRFNSLPEVGNLFSFSRTISGRSLRFEVVNLDFEDNGTYLERTPDPLSSFHLSYRSDGNGNTSPNTGFFLYMKQGELRSQTFSITSSEENRVIPITDTGVNELDVWVQNIDDSAFILPNGNWRKVQTVSQSIYTGDNISYNDIPVTERNIYEVITGDRDAISLRFSDGRFGNIPMGNVRCWYRVSDGSRYTIRPQDISDIQIAIPYRNAMGLRKTLTVGLSLQNSIQNSTPRESDEDIKTRAPQVYYTQNRMVSGEDYSTFPLQNNLARKIKAINRLYSGQSRYMDLNDPTATYQNVKVFSRDGVLFRDYDEMYFELPIGGNINQTSTAVVQDVIQPFLSDLRMRNFVQDRYLDIPGGKATIPLTWQQAGASPESSTGTFRLSTAYPTEADVGQTVISGVDQSIGFTAPSSNPLITRYIRAGSIVRFRTAGWVGVADVSGNGQGIVSSIGRVRLAEPVGTNDLVEAVLPSFRPTLDASENTAILSYLNGRKSFGLGYDALTGKWYIIEPTNIQQGEYNPDSRGTTRDTSWLISVEYGQDVFRIRGRGLLYVFESEKDVRFYTFNQRRVPDSTTGLAMTDDISILSVNEDPRMALTSAWLTNRPYQTGEVVKYRGVAYECQTPHTSGSSFLIDNPSVVFWNPVPVSLGVDEGFGLIKSFVYRDGYVEPRRVEVGILDSDGDGVPDNPEAFRHVIGKPLGKSSPQYLFWEKYLSDGYEYYRRSTINPYRVDAVAETYVDLTNPLVAGYVVFNNVPQKTTALTIQEGEEVLLLGQTQYSVDPQYVGENNRIYRLTGGVLLPVNQPSLVWVFRGEFFHLLDDRYHRYEFDEYRWYEGRAGLAFMWQHIAGKDHRIDPAVSNIIDIFVLTTEYDDQLRNWVKGNRPLVELPTPPSELELKNLFSDLEKFRMFSDAIVWKPARYRLLFGKRADEEYRVVFKVVKLPSTTMSDGEIKAQVIRAIGDFFAVSQWDFGDTFHWSELSAFIHQRLSAVLASIYLVPVNEEALYGNLQEIPLASDEIPISVATVEDVVIIPANTQTNLRIR